MLLTEFDEKKYKRTIYREGYEDGEQAGYSRGEQAGYSRGEYSMLEKLVGKKLQQGKDAALIAEELEVELDMVRKIIEHMSHS